MWKSQERGLRSVCVCVHVRVCVCVCVCMSEVVMTMILW